MKTFPTPEPRLSTFLFADHTSTIYTAVGIHAHRNIPPPPDRFQPSASLIIETPPYRRSFFSIQHNSPICSFDCNSCCHSFSVSQFPASSLEPTEPVSPFSILVGYALGAPLQLPNSSRCSFHSIKPSFLRICVSRTFPIYPRSSALVAQILSIVINKPGLLLLLTIKGIR